MDAVDALATTPLVKVDDNTGVSIVGKSGVAVMINDRILNLSDAELVTYLKSLRSENIEKIEVITAPPAKYEAQGNSGLINIVLKEKSKHRMEWKPYQQSSAANLYRKFKQCNRKLSERKTAFFLKAETE